MSENTDVVVIGGGYAGVMAANRLTQRADLTVTLVDARPSFVERIRLHQLVGGSDDALVGYRDVVAGSIRLVVDTATRIDAARRQVTLAHGGALSYDYLVYAVGSHSADPGVPGAADFAYPIATLEEAQRLRPVVAAASATAAVTVVGAGPTGIETAAKLAEQARTVTLVCGGALGPYLHPRGRRAVAKRLGALGVSVLDGPDTTVTAVTPDVVHLRDGREVPSVVTIWTAGFGVPGLAARSGLSTDALGRLLTDETLTSVDDERVVAAGDCAAPCLGRRWHALAAAAKPTQRGGRPLREARWEFLASRYHRPRGRQSSLLHGCRRRRGAEEGIAPSARSVRSAGANRVTYLIRRGWNGRHPRGAFPRHEHIEP